MDIRVDNALFLSQVTMTDVPALVQYLNNEKIYRNTLKIPFPYTRADAGWFVSYVEEQKQRFGCLTNWAIRNSNRQLIGGVGFHVLHGIQSHKDEIGYWLGEPFWGKGIMPKVIEAISRLAFEERGLIRLEACVFEHNLASARVLEKSGFTYEGILKNYFVKNGIPITVKMYAKTKPVGEKTDTASY
jgi:ribosomal-protein-alanine N-acetyltransferase